MKKILTVSLVAMMAVSAAHADLASTAYVDTVAAAEAGAVNKTLTENYSTTAQMNAAIGTAVSNATGDNSALAGRVTTAEGKIATLEASVGADGTTTKAIEAAQSAADAAQATADKKQNALTAGDFIQIEEGTDENLGKTFIKTTYTAGANVDISDTGVISATDTVYDDTEVRGLISDNANAIDAIEKSAYATSGITSELVGKISTNESAITTLNAGAQTAGSVDNKIAVATANMATDGELESGLATKQNTLTATATIGIAEDGAISVTNASIGETQLSEDVNEALALADTSFQMSAVKAAAEGGDGQYALTMTVGADNSITYQWNKISYGN